jgi:alcohol dehydrogenase class IV
MISFIDGNRLPAFWWSGPGARHRLPEAKDLLKITRLMVVASESALRLPGLRDDLSGCDICITGATTQSAIAAAAAQARAFGAQAVLSIGGGVAHDMAKAIALTAPSGLDITAFLFNAPPAAVTPLPVLAMPGTFSAAEMVAGGAVILDGGGKTIFGHPNIQPKAVFLDGEVAAATPRAVLAASGLNAVHHCTEAVYSIGHQAVSDAWALFALERLVRLLPALAPDAGKPDVQVFQDMLEAASMSGLAYSISGLGIGHAVCHSLAGRWAVTHGNANAVMLRHSAAFNQEHAPERIALAARAIGSDNLVASLDALCARMGTPRTLREAGLPAREFDQITEDVLTDPVTATNPRPVDAAGVIKLLEAAW